jgi:hypothetical protein
MILKGLWGLSFLWLGISAYQGRDLLVIILLWAFALTMMAHRVLSYQHVRRNIKG